jgi:SAM-dependent methyltransferase
MTPATSLPPGTALETGGHPSSGAPPSALATQLASFGGQPGDPRFAIDPRDEMLHFLVEVHGELEQAECSYFRTGHAIAAALAAVLRWRFPDDPSPVVLDFASGYGRVTRFLLDAVPASRLWVSDVLGDAVTAQRAAFGVGGFTSTLRPEDLAAPRQFDAVTVTSLFTHLPEARFAPWLAALWKLVTPRGVLVFSTHDVGLHPDVDQRERDFVFERTSESRSLEVDDYGTTWVSEGFVRAAIRSVAGDAAAHRLPRALCNFQDLWVVVPGSDGSESAAPFAALRLPAEPDLTVETCTVAAGELALSGWAVSRYGRLESLELTLDSRPLGSVPVGLDRGDIASLLGEEHRHCGWRWSGPIGRREPAHAVLAIHVVGAGGERRLAWVGSLQLLQLLTARLTSQSRHGEVSRLERELEYVRASAAAERAGLLARLAAMEASRFWKLRNGWFAVKRALGLTAER